MKRSLLRCKSDFDGREIVAHLYEPDSQSRPYSMIFGHGFSESKEKYRPIGEEFAENGIRTVIPDMRGHGESRSEFRIDAMANDIVTLARVLKTDFRSGHVAAGGVSMSAYACALAQTYDTERQIDGEVLVMVPRTFKKYVEKFRGYKPLRNAVLRTLAKTPVGYAIKIIDKDLGKTRLFGGDILFRNLHVGNIARFISEIDNSADIVEVYSNGFHMSTPTLLVCDETKKEWHDYMDSRELAAAMENSKNGNNPTISLEAMTDPIGRDTGNVAKAIARRAINFFDEEFRIAY